MLRLSNLDGAITLKLGALLALAVSAATLPNLAAAQMPFGAPPTDSYTLNITLEDATGKTLVKESRKCDPLRWCDGEAKQFTINGKPRTFWLKSRWQLNMLSYQRMFANPKDVMGGSSHELPFRKNEKEVELFYDTNTGAAWKGHPAFDKGPIAKLTVEIRY